MTKYIQDLKDFADHLSRLSDVKHYEWFSDFLFKGYTAPFMSISPNQPWGSIVDLIYNLSNTNNQKRIYNDIKEIYKSFSGKMLTSYAFVEVLETIARLNVTELLPDLWEVAYKGEFKNRLVEELDASFDIHTYILKTLFGLTIEKKDLKRIIGLARRDIEDPKYMLECFYKLYNSFGYLESSIKYIPMILDQIPNKHRDYEGAIAGFLKSFSKEDIVSCLVKIGMMLNGNVDQLDKFQYILEATQIKIDEEYSVKGKYELLLRMKDYTKKIYYKYISPIKEIYYRQMNREMIVVTILAREGKTKEFFFKDFKNRLKNI